LKKRVWKGSRVIKIKSHTVKTEECYSGLTRCKRVWSAGTPSLPAVMLPFHLNQLSADSMKLIMHQDYQPAFRVITYILALEDHDNLT
jgi:hypothetical protein